MKKIALIVVTAFATSITTSWLVIKYQNSEKALKIEHVSQMPVQNASFNDTQKSVYPFDFTDVSKKVMPAVVHIKSTQIQEAVNYGGNGGNNPFNDDVFKYFFGPQFRYESPKRAPQEPQTQVGTGSGVIISADGYIVTNNHVIDNADDIEITLNDNRVFKAVVVGTDPSTDVALLQIKEKDLPFIPFTDSDGVEVGEWVIAVGNPFNLNSTVTAGIVSAKARNINILKSKSAIESFIQTDAAINPGNSGGALVNMSGGLIDINTAIASPTGAYTGYGFAVPSDIVSKVVDDLRTYGIVQRGYLGLMIRSVDGNLAKEKELDMNEGVFVSEVAENSAAGDVGVKANDVIVEVDGVHVKTSSELLEIIGRHRPGDKVALKVDRKGKEKLFDVILKNQNGETQLADKSSKTSVVGKLGIELEAVDKAVLKKLDIESGVRVKDIESGVVKRQTNMNPGFIITRVDGKPIKNIEQFINTVSNKQGGIMIEGIYENMPGVHYYAFGLS